MRKANKEKERKVLRKGNKVPMKGIYNGIKLEKQEFRK